MSCLPPKREEVEESRFHSVTRDHDAFAAISRKLPGLTVLQLPL
jgi:hypothetical protein